MKRIHGVFLPDHEEHLLNFAKGPGWRYQWQKFQACLPWVKDWDQALDIGAHCGLWSMQMAPYFKQIVAFEPLEAHRECYELNVPKDAYTLHAFALGEKEDRVFIRTPKGQSGDSFIDGKGTIHVKRLDDVEGLNPGFVKIDTEGYELFILRGAVQMLERCKPCLIVEQKPLKGTRYGLTDTAAVEFLQAMGAELRAEIYGDYILSWD